MICLVWRDAFTTLCHWPRSRWSYEAPAKLALMTDWHNSRSISIPCGITQNWASCGVSVPLIVNSKKGDTVLARVLMRKKSFESEDFNLTLSRSNTNRMVQLSTCFPCETTSIYKTYPPSRCASWSYSSKFLWGRVITFLAFWRWDECCQRFLPRSISVSFLGEISRDPWEPC